MGAFFMLALFLSPALLAGFAKRFWPTIFAGLVGFVGLIAGLAWSPLGILLWCIAVIIAIRAHRSAWREQESERSSD